MGALTDDTKRRLRILVVDGHNTFAELLSAALDRESDLVSVGHATNGADALAMFADLRPDVVLMEVQLPDIDGFTASSQILAIDPEARVIMLTAHATPDAIAKAAISGVCGFLAKDGHLADLLRTVRVAQQGGLAVDPSLVTRLVGQPPTPSQSQKRPLSERELMVLVQLADGKDVVSIAHELRISSHTGRGHVKSVLSKLGAHSQLEAVVIAVRMGLVHIRGHAAKTAIY
jgi:DNA-binding NarL/FixJ family response regulator